MLEPELPNRTADVPRVDVHCALTLCCGGTTLMGQNPTDYAVSGATLQQGCVNAEVVSGTIAPTTGT